MDKMSFTQAVARLRVLEKRLLNKQKIERMIDSSSVDDVIKILQETEYASLMANMKRAEDYEILLKEELKRVYSLMYEISPESSIIDIMRLKYDYHNIKVLLKGKALDKDFSHMLIPSGIVDVEKLKSYILSDDYRDLNAKMTEAIVETQKAYDVDKDPQKIDIVLDKYMYMDMLERAKTTKTDFIINYVKKNIDFSNIKTIIRLKKQQKPVKFFKEVMLLDGDISEDTLIKAFDEPLEGICSKFTTANAGEDVKRVMEEYMKTGRLSDLEKFSEDYVMKTLKEAKYITFGPEPIFAYIIAKETEMKVIRIIMVGKLNNVDAGVIRERLRDVYA